MPIAASKAVFAVLAVGAGSVLGYNWMTTGCPSGVCPTERAAANVIPAALNAEHQGDTCSSSCSSDKVACDAPADQAAITTVANTTEASCESACETIASREESCEDKADGVALQTVALTEESEEKSGACCPLSEAAEQTASNAP